MSFFKLFSGYTIVSLIQALYIFINMVFFSHKMPIEDFGKYNLYLSILPILLNFMSLGFNGSISVFYHKVSRIKFRLYIGQIIFFLLPLSLIVGILLLLIGDYYIENSFSLNRDILFVIVLLVFVQILPQLLLTYYQTSQQLKNYLILNISYLTTIQITSILIYLIYESTFLLFLSLLIVSSLYSLYVIFRLIKLKLIIYKFNKKAINDILSYGLPLVLHSAGITVLFMSDRFFISSFLGNDKVAIYSISLQLSMPILVLVNSFASAWGPYLFRKLKNSTDYINSSIKRKMFIFIIVFLLLPFLIYYPQVIIFKVFFPKEYEIALDYILIISLGYAIMGIWKLFVGFLHFSKMTKVIFQITLLTLILNLILNYFLIYFFGTIGVAYATFISMFFLVFVTISIVVKKYNFIGSILE